MSALILLRPDREVVPDPVSHRLAVVVGQGFAVVDVEVIDDLSHLRFHGSIAKFIFAPFSGKSPVGKAP
jgi:hypothetical protein